MQSAVKAGTGAVLAMMALQPALAGDEGFTRTGVGGLNLRHDKAAWSVEATDMVTTFSCTDPETCGRATVRFEAVAGDATCSAASVIAASEGAVPGAMSRQVETLMPPGLTVHLATVDIGCRNLAGSPVYACTAHGGIVYRISEWGEGCRTPRENASTVRALLAGLSARD